MCARVRAAFLHFRIATQAAETFIARAGIGQESVLTSTVDAWITGALVDADGACRACVVVFTVARIRTVQHVVTCTVRAWIRATNLKF